MILQRSHRDRDARQDREAARPWARNHALSSRTPQARGRPGLHADPGACTLRIRTPGHHSHRTGACPAMAAVIRRTVAPRSPDPMCSTARCNLSGDGTGVCAMLEVVRTRDPCGACRREPAGDWRKAGTAGSPRGLADRRSDDVRRGATVSRNDQSTKAVPVLQRGAAVSGPQTLAVAQDRDNRTPGPAASRSVPGRPGDAE